MNDAGGVNERPKLSWRFPRTFWIANVAELFERAAYYGMFIALAMYLTDNVGFTDVETGYVMAVFAATIYLLPAIVGAIADKIGFRMALILAFALLAVGYLVLAAVPNKLGAIVSLAIIAVGGATVKPVISGTVAKCSDEAHRARAFSVFYWAVNIGAFGGKTVAAPLREHMGLEYINYYAAAMALIALVWVALFFRDVDRAGDGKTVGDVLLGFGHVLTNVRFMALILIVAGFWIIQGQLYAAMPKYVIRLLGESAKPEWLANVNPLVVVLSVVPITHLVRNFKPQNSIGIGLFIIPLSALAMALSPALASWTGNSVPIFGRSFHPITLMVVIGIAIQGLAECFLSPKYYEFASRQAPPGEEGLYMGYQNLTVFFAWLTGFALSGHLLDRFCPDPSTLSEAVREQWRLAIETGSPMPAAYAHAHYFWLVYAAIGAAAFVALLVFTAVTNRLDRRVGSGGFLR
jgi:dipeptide/tripeptide permease